MSFAWVAMTVWAGFTTKLQITARSTKKVGIFTAHLTFLIYDTGKYLLEKEKLIKENNWSLE